MENTPKSTRKEFLQTTAGLAAGAAALGTLGFVRPAYAAHHETDETITQIARFGLQDGKEEQAKELLASLVQGVQDTEPGVLVYTAHLSTKDSSVVFYEVYENQAALQAHGNTPHMNEMRTKFMEVFKRPLDVEVLTTIAGVSR